MILFERCWLYKTWKLNVQQVCSFSFVRLKRGGATLLIDRVLFCASSALYWIVVHTELDAVYCHFIFYHDYKGLCFQICLRFPLLISRKIWLLRWHGKFCAVIGMFSWSFSNISCVLGGGKDTLVSSSDEDSDDVSIPSNEEQKVGYWA